MDNSTVRFGILSICDDKIGFLQSQKEEGITSNLFKAKTYDHKGASARAIEQALFDFVSRTTYMIVPLFEL